MTAKDSPPSALAHILLAASLSWAVSHEAQAVAEFTFLDTGALDGQGIGASLSATDAETGRSATLTTVEIRGQDGSLASNGVAHVTHTLAGSSADALGIDSLNDTGTFANDERDFNPGEAWTFSFNVTVGITEIDFAGWGGTSSEVTLTFSDGTPPVVLSGNLPGDTFPVNTVVTAGTEVTMALTNLTGDQEVRLKHIFAHVTNDDIVYTDGDGGNWTTTLPNITQYGLPKVFESGDDVIFPEGSNSAVVIEPGGVTSGAVTWANTRNGRLKFLNGDLSCANLLNVDRGGVVIENATEVRGTATFEGNGELEIGAGGSLTFDTLLLSGDTLLEFLVGNHYENPDGTIVLGQSGADIRNVVDVTLGPVTSTVIENPLQKNGAGTLTFAGGLGTQTSGPVKLTLLEGAVSFAGTEQINLGVENVFDVSVFMDGPTVELHRVDIVGDGSLVVRKSSLLSPRFDGGDSLIRIPLIIESGQTLTVDPASGDNDLTISGELGGDGNLVKQGNGLCVISGFSGYGGDTAVEAGDLRFSRPILSDAGKVRLSGGGQLDLRHGFGDTVEALFIDGVQVEAGTYGSSPVSGVTLDVVDNSRFISTGWLVVTNGPPSADCATWAASFGLTGLANEDDDHDGISNSDEYAFGLLPNNSASVSPFAAPLGADGTFSYTRRNPTTFNTALTYHYEYSTSLTPGIWTELTTGFGEASNARTTVETITVTLPPALLTEESLFVRVVASY